MNEWGQQLPFETLPQMTMNNTIYSTCLLVSVPFRSLCTAVFVAVCPSHLGWQYKEVMPSSLSRLGSCEEINWFALGLNFISDSVDVASSRICSVHTTFPAVAARKFPWSVQWPELTYSPVDIQSSSNFDWKYLGLHIKIPFYFVGAINSVATVLCVKGS